MRWFFLFYLYLNNSYLNRILYQIPSGRTVSGSLLYETSVQTVANGTGNAVNQETK